MKAKTKTKTDLKADNAVEDTPEIDVRDAP
jgi:hypothetical protein